MDDLSRYMWVATIPSKDRAAIAIKEIQVQAEGISHLKLTTLHTYRGGECTVTEFAEYYVIEGCIISTQCPTTHNKRRRRAPE
jgi:hypothetical protein